MQKIQTLVITFLAIGMINCLPSGDEVTQLPGWKGPLKSKMYAGYIPAGQTHELGIEHNLFEHYIFIESEKSPANDPLIIWTNGGPGAASYFGLFIELGPYYLSSASLKTEEYLLTKVPTLFDNIHSWTKVANLLIINSPPPVGYSYCSPIGPSGNGTSCGTWNDSKTAVHNAIYIDNWFKAFPEYGSHEFFIIGESYGGIYVPTLVRELLNYYPDLTKNLQGFAIGDGCVGTSVLCGADGPGELDFINFFHGHGQFSEKLFNQIMKQCPYDQLLGFGKTITDPKCKAMIDQMYTQIGGYYIYSLYDDCWYQNDLIPPKYQSSQDRKWWGPPITTKEEYYEHLDQYNGALNDYPCGGPSAMFKWIQTAKVKEALHVPSDGYFFSGDNGYGFTYNSTEKNLLPFYREVIENTALRVLIYNGDSDPCINYLATQNWTSSLGYDEIQEWRPWTIDGKDYMGGYVTRYVNDFDFLTIRGSGHMVPQYKAKETLEFITRWLENRDWQRYTGQTGPPPNDAQKEEKQEDKPSQTQTADFLEVKI